MLSAPGWKSGNVKRIRLPSMRSASPVRGAVLLPRQCCLASARPHTPVMQAPRMWHKPSPMARDVSSFDSLDRLLALEREAERARLEALAAVSRGQHLLCTAASNAAVNHITHL